MTEIRLVSGWLTDLANLTAGNAMMREIKPRIAGNASMLADAYPAGAFTRASLDHVARQCKFFPSYSETCELLSAWWKENRPTPRAIESDQPATVRQRELERKNRESWETISAEQIRTKIRTIRNSSMPPLFGHFFATALAKYAPQHLNLLPPEWLEDRNEAASVTALRKPAVATPMHSEVCRSEPELRTHIDA